MLVSYVLGLFIIFIHDSWFSSGFLYVDFGHAHCCSGGRDLSGNKRTNKNQSFDQKFEKYNLSLKISCLKGYPVRVVR